MLYFYIQYLGFLTIGMWGAVISRLSDFGTTILVTVPIVILWVALTEWARYGPDYEEPTLGTE